MGARLVLAGSSVVLAIVLMTTVLSRTPLPGATPDALLVTVVALALVGGTRMGIAAGFGGGLLLDLTPPAIVPVGTNALAMLVIGAVVGRLAGRRDRTVPTTLLIVASAAIGSQALRALVGLLARDGRVDLLLTPWYALTSAAWALLLAPFIVPVVAAAYARLPRPGSAARAVLGR